MHTIWIQTQKPNETFTQFIVFVLVNQVMVCEWHEGMVSTSESGDELPFLWSHGQR